MIPTFRVPIAVRTSKEKSSSTPKGKTYSYQEVENMICRAIETLNITELIRRNSIDIECIPDCKERSLTVTIRRGNEACQISLKGGAE